MIQCSAAKDDMLGLKDGFLLVTMTWLFLSFFGAIPFYLSGYFPHFIDAFFESVSGFTTTGASILNNIEILPKGILFWRSFTHWIGGMGIIVLAVAILPQLSIGGMQLLKNETPGPTFQQLKPRIRQTALSLWKIYILFSVLQVFMTHLFGMSLFDSLCHMFGTMGTGGFSTRNASLGYYSPQLQMIVSFFMFLAGMNFVVHYFYLKGDFKKLIHDSEWKFYVVILAVNILIIALCLILRLDYSAARAFRVSLFQVLSITTTTGFATDDFNIWPGLAIGILFMLMFVGGCSGSTSGGIKQVRWLLLLKRARQSITQHIFPQAVVSVKLNQHPVSENVLQGVSSFLLIYLMIFAGCTGILLGYNIDGLTSMSAVLACLSNVGPGFGLVGPTSNYAFLPALIKFVLSLCMIIGRLEVFTVLVLFFPSTWRR